MIECLYGGLLYRFDIPESATIFAAVSVCRICDGWFIPGNVSCCVNHPAGECCHLGDHKLEPARVLTALDVMREAQG